MVGHTRSSAKLARGQRAHINLKPKDSCYTGEKGQASRTDTLCRDDRGRATERGGKRDGWTEFGIGAVHLDERMRGRDREEERSTKYVQGGEEKKSVANLRRRYLSPRRDPIHSGDTLLDAVSLSKLCQPDTHTGPSGLTEGGIDKPTQTVHTPVWWRRCWRETGLPGLRAGWERGQTSWAGSLV